MPNRPISIHALLAESDTFRSAWLASGFDFYPRSPCGERPRQDLINGIRLVISIHALLAESDPHHAKGPGRVFDFYPRSPCGERHCQRAGPGRQKRISIHALLAESDGRRTVSLTAFFLFLSTLSLRRATMYALIFAGPMLFLSTLSLRRATSSYPCWCQRVADFYPRSP